MKSIWTVTLTVFLLLGASFAGSATAQGWETPTQQHLEISDYVQFLNNSYDDLKVELNTSDPREALKQLDLLEGHLQGDFILRGRELNTLNCTRIVCGGGGGSCTTCLH